MIVGQVPARKERVMAGAAKTMAVLTDEEAARVRALYEAHGLKEACRLLGLSRVTVLSLLARVPVYPANVYLVRDRLAALAERA